MMSGFVVNLELKSVMTIAVTLAKTTPKETTKAGLLSVG
jgi:hypothetical protein